MMSVWPSDDHLENSDDELGEQSMSIILPTLCAWCVLQGRGALQEDMVRCDEACKIVASDPHCIGSIITDHKDWHVELLQEEITFLIAHGADPQHRSSTTGRLALHECAIHGSIRGMQALMTMDLTNLSGDNMLDAMLEDASVAHSYDRGDTAKQQDHDRKQANEKSIDLLETTNLGCSIVHLAAMKGHAQLLQEIVNHMSANLQEEKEGEEENWESLENDDGEMYYYNPDTGESVWNKPTVSTTSTNDSSTSTTPSDLVSPVDLFDAADRLGYTPASYAAEKGHVNCLKILFSALCKTKKNRHVCSFELNRTDMPHSRTLAHYAAMNGRVNVLMYLHQISACHHLHQDIECYYPVDIAKKFNRLGCVAYLTATCPHPFLNNSCCCGVCDTFLQLDNGPVYCPMPGHRNIAISDAIMDEMVQQHHFEQQSSYYQKKNEDHLLWRYHLWKENSNVGTNYPNSIRTDFVEIEDFTKAACHVLKYIGLTNSKLKMAQSDCVESCCQWIKKHDHLDSISCNQFHTFIRSLPAVQHLNREHQKYVCRGAGVKRKKKDQDGKEEVGGGELLEPRHVEK